MADKLTTFDYLLNAMLDAGRQTKPADHGYGEKRRKLYEHVRELERKAAAHDAPLKVYHACDRHMGLPFTFQAIACTAIPVCPHCEAAAAAPASPPMDRPTQGDTNGRCRTGPDGKASA